MIAITSLSPNHKNYDVQQAAVDSWVKEGYKVVSMNCPEEIESLKEFKNVEFVSTQRHNKHLFGRPYVIASALVDYFKKSGESVCMLINSDIKLSGKLLEKLKAKSKDGIIIMNRINYDDNNKIGELFDSGFDGFVIHKKWVDQIPETILCLGQCHWDYWIPWSAIQRQIPVFRLKTPYLFHKNHNTQYSFNDWKRTGEIFRKEQKLEKTYRDIGKMSSKVHSEILKKSIWLEL